MQRKTRLSSRCLLCFSNLASAKESDISGVTLSAPMLGAVNCSQLEKQLQHIFILTKLLDVSSSWCEETLARNSSRSPPPAKEELISDAANKQFCGDNSTSAGNPGSWFKVCGTCINSSVSEAWEIYQKTLRLETRMAVIKAEIKKRMRNGFKKHWDTFDLDNGTEIEIRNAVFPELAFRTRQRKRTDDDAEEEVMEWDGEPSLLLDDPLYTLSEEDDTSHSSSGALTSCVWEKPLIPVKRGRGRPRLTNGQRRLKIARGSSVKNSNFRCPDCDARFKNPELFQMHVDLHEQCKLKPDAFFICPECTFPAKDQPELDAHHQIRHTNAKKPWTRTFSCPKCNFNSRVYKLMRAHVNDVHPEVTEEELNADISIVCADCGKTLPSTRSFAIHKRQVHPETLGIEVGLVECDQCPKRFSNALELRYHIYNTHKRASRFVCDECGQGFKFMSKLKKHQKIHLALSNKRTWVCDLCGLDYTDKFTLSKHQRKFHPAGSSGDKKAPATPDQLFECKYCDLKSPFKPVITRHMQTHKAEMGNKCDECGKFYTSQAALRRHQSINHPKEKVEVPCPLCRKVFPSVAYMKDHQVKFCRVKDIDSSSKEVNVRKQIPQPQDPISSLPQNVILLNPSQVVVVIPTETSEASPQILQVEGVDVQVKQEVHSFGREVEESTSFYYKTTT